MTDARLVYVTAGSHKEALAIARTVVERRLAACANILDAATSVYWWQGKVETDAEVVMFLKTTSARVTELVETIRSRHSYDCPAISVVPIEGGNRAYLDWIAAETAETNTDHEV